MFPSRHFLPSLLMTLSLSTHAAALPPPPDAAPKPHQVKAPHGAVRRDEYYWLRDDKRKDKAVLGYLRAENAYADAVLAPLKPLEDTVYAEIVGRIQQDDDSVPYRERGWWYSTRYRSGQDYPVYLRAKAAADGSRGNEEQVLLDVEAMAKGKAYFKVDAWDVSQDNRLLAWAEDDNGRRQYTIRIKDLETGELYPETIRGVSTDLVWADDNRTLFYVENDPETLLTVRVKKHVLGTPVADDVLVYEEPDDSYYIGIGRTRDDRFLCIDVESTVSSETPGGMGAQWKAKGKLDAILALGGSGGSSIATAAMRALPIGVPKLMVSTIAAGNVAPYVGASDIMMLYPVVDLAGLNVVSERVIANAATAIAAMAKAAAEVGPIKPAKPVVAITMFGVTTPAATAAREYLEQAGYEVLVFHANGAGGRAMEALIRDGIIQGVLDLTTTELADEVAGGELSAGPDRLEIAGAFGLPQVVSLGALDMVNFGPLETVPEKFRARKLHRHNPHVTLMRTSVEECAAIGSLIAKKLNRAEGPAAVYIPLRGVSSISKKGGVFFDPAADAALIAHLRNNLSSNIECVFEDADINDAGFARAMAARLHTLLQKGRDK